MTTAPGWEPDDIIGRYMGDRADAIDWAYIDNLTPDECRDLAKECIRQLHDLVGAKPPLGRCARCDGDIWLDLIRVPWAPDAVFHVACDLYVVRVVLSVLAPSIDARQFIDRLTMAGRMHRG